MLLESLNTIAAFSTLIVIGVAAYAAIVQLGHLRASNQLSGLLTILHYSQDPKENERRSFVINDLEDRLKDAEFRRGLMQRPVNQTIHVEITVCDFFEHIGSYVKSGLIDERAYLDTACDFVNMMWDKLEPVIAVMRRTRDETLYDNFEYLTARSRLWIARHPKGTYPKNTARVPVHDRWLEIDNGAQKTALE